MKKRSCSRFSVPGATLRYKKRSKIFGKGRFDGDYYPVLDISRGGAKFVCNHRVRPGTPIVLRLEIPDLGEAIEILGAIRWANRNQGRSYRFQVGIAFNPYGQKKKENPPGVLEKLKALELAYTDTDASAIN